MKRILFLNLTAFSQTGGIERFNRCLLKALSDLDAKGITDSHSLSAYDTVVNELYYDAKKYRGFNKNKAVFALLSILNARRHDIIFLGHINLAIVGLAIKKIYPGKKVILITHGVEVWKGLRGNKKKILHVADRILSVSSFTKKQIQEVHHVPADRIHVFPNTIDPYFPIPENVTQSNEMRSRYGIADDDFVLYTLTRLSDTEQFKGYDKVIVALASLVKEHPEIRYVIAGKYDEREKNRLHKLIEDYGLSGHVILTGFLPEAELVAHYRMSDLYVMPSRKEGFGIVFIEALVCGLPVIAGNADGSVDALLNGALGTLVNPESVAEIGDAIRLQVESASNDNESERLARRQKTLDNFAFDRYRQRMADVIAEC